MESQDFSLGLNFNNTNNNDSMSDQEDYAHNDVIEFKIILVGNASVGKTSIINKFITGEFSPHYKSTITVECKSKFLKIDKKLLAKLNIWDTCGSEIFRAVTRQYYRGAHAAIVIFDLTEQKTFNDIKQWLKDIHNCGDKNIEIIIVGNKLDLDNKRKVTQSQAMNFCREKNYKYIEASAKNGTNILKIFEELTDDLAKNHQKKKEKEKKDDYILKTLNEKESVHYQKELKKEPGCC